jgi:hypothetical protein
LTQAAAWATAVSRTAIRPEYRDLNEDFGYLVMMNEKSLEPSERNKSFLITLFSAPNQQGEGLKVRH